jgi:peptidylprolyl isomerase
MFDSSVSRGKPVTFRVDLVIRGWQEMIEKMVTGEKVRAWVPAKLAYGDAPPGAPGVDQGATPWGDLVFDLELLDIQQAPKPR